MNSGDGLNTYDSSRPMEMDFKEKPNEARRDPLENDAQPTLQTEQKCDGADQVELLGVSVDAQQWCAAVKIGRIVCRCRPVFDEDNADQFVDGGVYRAIECSETFTNTDILLQQIKT